MIKLKGQIHIPKIRGTIYRIAGEGSGGPLQAKTVYPSHSEQIIAPDEDYYGLVSVTVKPVPRLPAAAMRAEHDGDNLVGIVVDVGAAMIAEGSDFVQTHALYSGERLPVLPDGLLDQYPYAWIWWDSTEAHYELYFSTGIWYASDSLSYGRYMYRTVSETTPVYKATEESETWELLGTSSSNVRIGSYNDGKPEWANFSVPSGSSTSTSYLIRASEPQLTI